MTLVSLVSGPSQLVHLSADQWPLHIDPITYPWARLTVRNDCERGVHVRSFEQGQPLTQEMKGAAACGFSVVERRDSVSGAGTDCDERAVEGHRCLVVPGRLASADRLGLHHVGGEGDELDAGDAVPQRSADTDTETTCGVVGDERPERLGSQVADPQLGRRGDERQPCLDLGESVVVVAGERKVKSEAGDAQAHLFDFGEKFR